jgi:hypothetical protein
MKHLSNRGHQEFIIGAAAKGIAAKVAGRDKQQDLPPTPIWEPLTFVSHLDSVKISKIGNFSDPPVNLYYRVARLIHA